jgi:hypothetical protein
MRRMFDASAFVAWLAACTSFSAGQGGADGGGDASVSADSGADDAPADASGEDSGVVFDQTFGGSCTGWNPTAGAGFVFSSGSGRDGGGACLLSFPMGGVSSLVREEPASQSGTYQLDVWVRAADDASPGCRAFAGLTVGYADGGVGTERVNTSPLDTSVFHELQVTTGLAVEPANVHIRLEAVIAPCDYYVDEIRLVRQ